TRGGRTERPAGCAGPRTVPRRAGQGQQVTAARSRSPGTAPQARRRDRTIRDSSGDGSRGQHLLIELPGSAAVAGDLGAPGERVRGDVGEPPPRLRVLPGAEPPHPLPRPPAP